MTTTQANRLSGLIVARVVGEDMGWLFVFIPLGILFHCALLLARGYYAVRRWKPSR